MSGGIFWSLPVSLSIDEIQVEPDEELMMVP